VPFSEATHSLLKVANMLLVGSMVGVDLGAQTCQFAVSYPNRISQHFLKRRKLVSKSRLHSVLDHLVLCLLPSFV